MSNEAKDFIKQIKKMVADEVAVQHAIFLKQIVELQKEIDRLSKEPRVLFNPTLQVPQIAPPAVNVQVAAPIVNPTPVDVQVVNKVEAPIVHPTPVDVHVAAPSVTVEPAKVQIEKSAPPVVQVNMPEEIRVKLPERKVQTYLTRDEKTGRATGSVSTEMDVKE